VRDGVRDGVRERRMDGDWRAMIAEWLAGLAGGGSWVVGCGARGGGRRGEARRRGIRLWTGRGGRPGKQSMQSKR
jgi:hypothetical protein